MTRPLTKPLYDNVVALAPDGTPLCRCSHDKADWYLQRNLAEVVEPNVIRLKFQPKGRGHAGDDFYLSEKANVCVVCGSVENHTRHHIVPHCFRRHFPDRVKRHNSHDIVPLCIPCHDQYEFYASVLKQQIAFECHVPIQHPNGGMDMGLYKIKRHASALQMYRDRIPQGRLDFLMQTMREYFNKDEITDDDIDLAARLDPVLGLNHRSFGKRIVDKIENLEAFIIRWREHFVRVMRPKHMNKYWSVNKKVIGL